MKFILISTPGGRIEASLVKAAKKYGIEVILLHDWKTIEQLDPSQYYCFYSTKTPSSWPNYMELEEYLNKNFNLIKLGTRFRETPINLLNSFRLAGLPMAHTEFLESRDPAAIKEIIEKIGDFPLVVRAPGKQMRGRGIIKIDSMTAFKYLLDYLPKDRSITIQQYIEHPYTARIIVLGDEVIFSYCNPVAAEEFRSNVYEVRDRFIKEFSPEINEIAVEATRVRYAKFAGVDILFTKDEEPYLAEVNFPCNFLPPEEQFDFPVAEKIMGYFLQCEKQLTPLDSRFRGNDEKLIISTTHENEEVQLLKTAAKLFKLQKNKTINYPPPQTKTDTAQTPTRTLTKNEREKIPQYVAELGGYPIFIKTFDQAHEPYLYADSYQTAVSLCDYCWIRGSQVQFEPSIADKIYGGIVIVGNEVAASIRYLMEDDSLLTDPPEYTIMPASFADETEQQAINAATSQFCLVKFLLSKNNNCVITEVADNFEFAPIQRTTGINIAEKLLANIL